MGVNPPPSDEESDGEEGGEGSVWEEGWRRLEGVDPFLAKLWRRMLTLPAITYKRQGKLYAYSRSRITWKV